MRTIANKEKKKKNWTAQWSLSPARVAQALLILGRALQAGEEEAGEQRTDDANARQVRQERFLCFLRSYVNF